MTVPLGMDNPVAGHSAVLVNRVGQGQRLTVG
jgi:hypothetical protein